MRHIFDQYKQPVNKLTHSFVSSLALDKNLFHDFIKWTTGSNRGFDDIQVKEGLLKKIVSFGEMN